MEFNKDTPFISVRLSKSGKAVLIYDLDGNAFMTSVAYMKMLIEGKARNNMISARFMGGNTTDNFKRNSASWDMSKIRKVEGNPLSAAADRERYAQSTRVKGDW